MSKYIVEIKPEYEDSFKGLMILGAKDSNLFVDTLAVEDLEELNSDYINEHFSDLQDTAYQRGLDDAWEAARRVAFNSHMGGLSVEDLEKAFDCLVPQQVFKNYTAQQIIEKLKAYEEKQKADDEIKVGDEVEDHTDSLHKKAAVLSIKGDVLHVIAAGGGTWMLRKNNAVRTGRHFDIDKILEEMRE